MKKQTCSLYTLCPLSEELDRDRKRLEAWYEAREKALRRNFEVKLKEELAARGIKPEKIMYVHTVVSKPSKTHDTELYNKLKRENKLLKLRVEYYKKIAEMHGENHSI